MARETEEHGSDADGLQQFVANLERAAHFAVGGALAHVNATIRSERLRIAGTAQGLSLEAA